MEIRILDSIIRELEATRCAALVRRDLATLDELAAPDLVHVHTTGRAESKEEWLNGVRQRLIYLTVDREALMVRGYGDIAIATGLLRQRIRIVESGREVSVLAFTTQIWRCEDERWQLCSFQATEMK